MDNFALLDAIRSIVREELSPVKTDVAALREDMSSVKSRLGVLEADVAVLKEDMSSVKSRLGVLEADVATLKTDVAALQEDMTFTKETAMRMELEHGDQLRALFDGYTANTEKLAEHSAMLARIDRKMEQMDIVQSYHSRELKKIAE